MRKKSDFQVDLEKYYLITFKSITPKFKQKLKIWLFNLGLQCVAVYRLGQFSQHLYLKNKIIGFPLRFIYLLLNYLVLFFHHVEILTQCKIGPGFHISHVGNIYIGAEVIGENFTITHNVTIGLGFQTEGTDRPIIGNNVWIGTGSVLAGNIKIEDGVTISSGCILTRDVPYKCLVGGNPGRVILKNYDNGRMLVYKMPDKEKDKIVSIELLKNLAVKHHEKKFNSFSS